MWTGIAAVIRLITLLLSEKLTRDKERKRRKKELRKELAAAITSRDPSEMTKAFDRIKHL